MILLLDIGNTNCHLGLGTDRKLVRYHDIPTNSWAKGGAAKEVARWIGRERVSKAVFCSVVPSASPLVRKALRTRLNLDPLELTSKTAAGIGIHYPKPETIGPDRLANAIAAKTHYGAPAVVVDFGTAVTFDVVDAMGDYVGGVIAPGLSAMTDYLHEKTALLPRIKIRETRRSIGKSTAEAMLIGAVHGYRGLIRELLAAIQKKMDAPGLPVIATGGCARLIASKMPEITAVEPQLTLEGLRLTAAAQSEGFLLEG